MSQESSDKSENPKKKPMLMFHSIKTAGFRAIHCDGMVGGVGPNGNLYASVYCERPPIPKTTGFSVDVDEETKQFSIDSGASEQVIEVRKGLIRDIEAVLVLDYKTASAVAEWLNAQINDWPKDKR